MRIIIPDANNKYNIERAALVEALPYDIEVLYAGNGETLRWGKEIDIAGDKLIINGIEYNMPINYQLLRFKHGRHRNHGPESSRSYSLRPQLLIPRDALVIGFVGNAKDFHNICTMDWDGVFYIGAILDIENISKYKWPSNSRTVTFEEDIVYRAVLYQTLDLLIENSDWSRPTLEAVAAGIPVVTIEQIETAKDDIRSLYSLLKPLNNDEVYMYDRSYMVRDLIEDWDLGVETPLISICINAYNREHLLPYAIESAIRQSYTNIEIVIVDDCSSDRTKEIILDYANQDPRIVYKFLKKNLGCPGSWSKAMELSTGQYVIYTSSDNIQDYGQIWHLNRYIQKENVSIVYGKPRYFGGQNRIVFSRNVNRNTALNCAGLGPSFLIPRWLLDETDLMHDEDLYVEDTSLTADMCTIGAQVSMLPYHPLYYYRFGDQSSLTAKVEKMGGYGKLLEKMRNNRERRRNEALSKVAAIYIKDMDTPKSMNSYIVTLMKLGFNGKIYVATEEIANALSRFGYTTYVGIPTTKSGNCCEWGNKYLVIGGSGHIYRCPHRNVCRGRVYGDFFINSEPRPCYMSRECEGT